MSTQLNIVRDPVDELLKADAGAQPYIDDAGFTLKVMDALPLRPRSYTAMRIAIPFAFTVLSAIIVAFFAGGENFFIDGVMDIATNTITKTSFTLLAIVAVMLAVPIAAVSDN
jgi:hypothetical protein